MEYYLWFVMLYLYITAFDNIARVKCKKTITEKTTANYEKEGCRPDFYCHFLPKNEPYREGCIKDVALKLWGPVICALTLSRFVLFCFVLFFVFVLCFCFFRLLFAGFVARSLDFW